MARHLCIFGFVIALFSTTPSKPVVRAQQPQCLHGADEAPDQAIRRQLALTLVRRINSYQIQQFADTKVYRPLNVVADLQTPPGFLTQLTVNETGYALSVKDVFDPCHFAFFSDQDQVVYEAQAIR